MEDGELGGRAYAHVLALAQEPRGAVTDGERRAQEYVARTLGAVCDAVERHTVTGIPAPMSFSWLLVIGLVLFLLAHVVYAVGFTLFNGFHPGDLAVGLVLLILGAGVYAYLWPGLGGMKLPVALYVVIICLMVNRAASTFFGTAFTITQALLLTAGALLFWLSDLMLAVNRFRRPFRYHRLSLALYYGGQLLIALSPAYFGR